MFFHVFVTFNGATYGLDYVFLDDPRVFIVSNTTRTCRFARDSEKIKNQKRLQPRLSFRYRVSACESSNVTYGMDGVQLRVSMTLVVRPLVRVRVREIQKGATIRVYVRATRIFVKRRVAFSAVCLPSF